MLFRSEQLRLQKCGQSYEEERAKISNNLAEKESVLLNKINEAVISYIEKYNEEKKYSLILSTNTRNINSPVILGNKSLDITSEIIKGLNELYVKNKK